MRRGVLGTKVDCVVADRSFLRVAFVSRYVQVIVFVFLRGTAETFIDRDKPGALAYWLGETAMGSCGEKSGEGASEGPGGSEAKTFGGAGGEAEEG